MTVFSPKTLAERWDCHPSAIRKLIHEGRLQSFRVGNLMRIQLAEVERFECSGTVSPDTRAGSSSNTMTAESDTEERCVRLTWAQRTQRPGT